jgi:hypothetical protein
MLPTGINKGRSIYSGLTLEGGFEDVNGDFVLYGYRDMGGSQRHPFYMVIDQNYDFNFFWHDNNPIGRFVNCLADTCQEFCYAQPHHCE